MANKLNIYKMNGLSGMSYLDAGNLNARLTRVESVVPYKTGGGNTAPNTFSTIDSSGLINGKLNLAVPNAIKFSGAMAPAVADGQFSVACPSDSTATIYWDGTNASTVFVMRAADQTNQTIPGSSISLSGLTASAAYSAYPYWVPVNACGLGFAPGDTGTPQIAFSSLATATQVNTAQSLQNLAGREALPKITWTQPAPSGSSAATANGTGFNCVRMGTLIEPLGSYGPSEIEEILHPQSEWIHLEAEGFMTLECTPDHPLYHAEHGKMKAGSLAEGDLLITRFGERKITNLYSFIRPCTKVEVKMKRGHLFWANGFLSHNFKSNLIP